MKDRAIQRDTPGGERTMAKTVAMHNLITGKDLTEEQGWLFMVMLKIVRGSQGEFREDDYVDAAAYCALQGEAAAKEALRKKTVRETLTLTKPNSTQSMSDLLTKDIATRVRPTIPILNVPAKSTEIKPDGIPTLTITATNGATNVSTGTEAGT
jgi:hypothetical protein